MEFKYIPSEDTWKNKEYVIVNEDNKVIAFFAWNINHSNKKIDGIRFIKFDRREKLPRKIMLERLLRDYTSHDMEIMEFTGVEGGYPNEKYKKLSEKGIITYSGLIKNFARLNDGKIYDASCYIFTREQLLNMIDLSITCGGTRR